MTVIRPNSVSGITSITAQANEINFFRSNGTLAGLQLNGVNFNTTSGISTFAALKVTGNLDVEGVLTYQDVTNVDSVGIITARSTIDAQGDVSIVDKIIHTGDTNTAIRFPSNDNISFEVAGVERLRIDNVDGVVAKHTTAANLRVQNSTAATGQVAQLDLAPANGLSGVQLRANSEEDFSTGANRTAFFSAHVRKDGTFYERLRITSAGNLALGNDGSFPIYTETNDRNFILGTGSDDVAIQLHSGTTKYGGIYFGDATSGGDRYNGYVEYKHDDNFLRIATNGAERLRISSSGALSTNTTGTVIADFNTSNSAGAYLQFDTGVSGANIGYMGAGSQLVTGSQTNDLGLRSENHMVFSTGGAVERLRINSNGEIYCTTSSVIVLDLNTTSSSGAYLQFDIGASGANIGYMGAGSQLVSGSATADLGIRSAANLVFSTGGATERLRVDSSGNVLVASGQVLVGGTSLGAAGSFGIEPNGHVRSVLAAGSTGDTLFGAISGISNGFQVNISGSNDQLYRFHNGSQVSMQIDSSGRVTKPLTPSFQAYGVSGTQSSVLTFSNTYHNIGNHFNAGTGYFTCPVAGRYLFTFAFLHNTNPTSYARVLFQLNGSRTTQYGDTLCDDTGLYINTSMCMIFNLSANDTVALYNEGNNIYSSQYGAFSGILLA